MGKIHNFSLPKKTCVSKNICQLGRCSFLLDKCGQKKGPHTQLTSSGETCMQATQTGRQKVTTWDGGNIKIPNQKGVMVGSPVLGL